FPAHLGRVLLKANWTTSAGSIKLQPPRLFQTNNHLLLGAIETNSEWGTGTERSLGKTIRNGRKGFASKASSIASILILLKVMPGSLARQWRFDHCAFCRLGRETRRLRQTAARQAGLIALLRKRDCALRPI